MTTLTAQAGAFPAAPSRAVATQFAPVKTMTIDLAEPLPTIRVGDSASGAAYGKARVLVMLHETPLGVVWVDIDDIVVTEGVLAAAVMAELGDRISAHLRADGLPDAVEPSALARGFGHTCPTMPVLPADAPLVSVVLATRGRPETLPCAIDSVLASDHPHFELVLVDNGPDDGTTAALVAQRYADDPRVRLVAEPRPGLSHARNRGLDAARGDVVAFTDDDVAVHPAWLRRIAVEFADPDVACVTGLVEPFELETVSQWWFETGVGFGRGIDRLVFHLTRHPEASPLFPYEVGRYGAGASMSLRRSALPSGWMFDPALGAGSLTKGGEDIDLFLDVLLGGRTLVYQPAALCFHRHRPDEAGAHLQMVGFGRGLTALLAKRLSRRPAERGLLLRRLLAGVCHALSPDFRSTTKENPPVPTVPYPRSLRTREMVGMLQGPLAYAFAASRARRVAPAAVAR